MEKQSAPQNHYDYIIAGAGCSGLSLAWHLLQYPTIRTSRIALVDPHPYPKNDKTWCFWVPESIPKHIPFKKSWDVLQVYFPNSSRKLHLKKLSYHCISSEDYSRVLLDFLKLQENVTFIETQISDIKENSNEVRIKTEKGEITGDFCFQSFGNPSSEKSTYPLLQHFGGWEIKTASAQFDENTATLMDFRVMKEGDPATFVYVLPYSSDSALVEFTVFSERIYEKETYDAEIAQYILKVLNIDQYTVERSEYGVIPMADRLHHSTTSKRIIPIGTASGIPKASTGYAFSRIQRQAASLAKSISEGHPPALPTSSTLKYRFFDLLLLDILQDQKSSIIPVFEALFQNNPPDRVLRFLDEQTTLTEDFTIMASVPPTPFIKAIVKNITTLGTI